MHARIENNQVIEYPIINIRQYLSNISLPTDLKNDRLLPEGFVYVNIGTPPSSYNKLTHKIIQNTIPVFTGIVWEIQYVIVTLNAEELIQVQKDMVQSIRDYAQTRLDEFVQTHGYNNILEICTYINSSKTLYRNEAQYCMQIRDDTWDILDKFFDDVDKGQEILPQNVLDIEPLLPILDWSLNTKKP